VNKRHNSHYNHYSLAVLKKKTGYHRFSDSPTSASSVVLIVIAFTYFLDAQIAQDLPTVRGHFVGSSSSLSAVLKYFY